MKKKNKIISLLTAAAMLPVFPLPGTAHAGFTPEWGFDSPLYDEDGDLYYDTVKCRLEDYEYHLPSEINGIPLKNIDAVALIEDWLGKHKFEEKVDDLNVYLPEGVQLKERDIQSISGDLNLYYKWPCNFRANFILSDGTTYVYETDPFNDYYNNSELDEDLFDEYGEIYAKQYSKYEFVPEFWDYDVLTDEDGNEYIKLTGYHGWYSSVCFPKEIDGIPVKAVGEKLFGETERMMRCYLDIPSCITEFDDDCFYGLHAAFIDYGFFRYALISDYDPETPDYLDIISDRIIGLFYESGYYDLYSYDESQELFYKNLEENLKDGVWSDPIESIANYPVKGVAKATSWAEIYNAPYLPFPDSIAFIRSGVLVDHCATYVHIPKSLQILPSYALSLPWSKQTDIYEGWDNINYFPRKLFSSDKVYNIEEYVDPDKLLPEGVYVDDPFVGFHINDDEGRSFRIIMDKKDFNYYAHLIDMPSDVKDYPEEFMGFPVIDERSDKLYASSSSVRIPEDMTELSLGSFTFDPIDFPELRTDLSYAEYPTYENAVRGKLKNAALKSIKSVEVLSKDITIKAGLFFNGELTEISFPGDVTVEKAGFSNSAVADLSFKGSGSTVKLGENAFFRAKIVNLEFADDIKELTLDKNAMYGIKATEITLPEGVKSIGRDCFSSCMQLQKLTINGSPEIGDSAFTSCQALTEVTITGKPKLGSEVFRNCKSLKVLNIDLDLLAESDILLTCPNITTINGEDIFDKNGVPNPKFVDIIESKLKETDDNKLINQYVMYRVKKMVSETVTDNMTDMQKVKALHDKLCSMVEYDTGNEDATKNHTDVSVFLHDKSVCEGYARAFDLLMHEIGIDSCYVYNDSHAWNIIKIGGHYFHIDSTWDDGDVVEYTWFMKNDTEIKDETSHITWDIKYPSSIHSAEIDQLPVCSDTMGDVNCDGVVDAIDASAVLSSYARASAGDKPTADAVLGDVNFNGKVDAVDASEILTRYAAASVDE